MMLTIMGFPLSPIRSPKTLTVFFTCGLMGCVITTGDASI